MAIYPQQSTGCIYPWVRNTLYTSQIKQQNTLLTFKFFFPVCGLCGLCDFTQATTSPDWDSCAWCKEMHLGPGRLSLGHCSLSLQDLCLGVLHRAPAATSLLRPELPRLFLREACPDSQPNQIPPFIHPQDTVPPCPWEASPSYINLYGYLIDVCRLAAPVSPSSRIILLAVLSFSQKPYLV